MSGAASPPTSDRGPGCPRWYGKSTTRKLNGGQTDDDEFWFECAALLLSSGDCPGYARACTHMVEALGKAGGPQADHVARACGRATLLADAREPGRTGRTGPGADVWAAPRFPAFNPRCRSGLGGS